MSEDRPRLSHKTGLALGLVSSCVAGYTALGLDSLVKQSDYDIVPSGEGAARVLGATAITGAITYGLSRVPKVASWGSKITNWLRPQHECRRRMNGLGILGLGGFLVGSYFSAREGDTLHPTAINGRSAIATIEATIAAHYERVGQNIASFNHTWRGLPGAPDSDEIERTKRIQQSWTPIPYEANHQSSETEMIRRLQQTEGLVYLCEIGGKSLTAKVLYIEGTNPNGFSSYDLFYDGKRVGGECDSDRSLTQSNRSYTGYQLWFSAPASNPFGEGYGENFIQRALCGYPNFQRRQSSNPLDGRYTIDRAYLVMDQLASDFSHHLWIRSLGGQNNLFGTPLRNVRRWAIFAQDQDTLYFPDQEGQLHQMTLTGEDRRVTSNDVPEEIFRYLRGR